MAVIDFITPSTIPEDEALLRQYNELEDKRLSLMDQSDRAFAQGDPVYADRLWRRSEELAVEQGRIEDQLYDSTPVNQYETVVF